MSLVYVTHHDENIFDIEKEPQQRTRELKRYVSRFKNIIKEESNTLSVIQLDTKIKLLTNSAKCEHKTMGYAEIPLNNPCSFLRKDQGVQWIRKNYHQCPKTDSLPPVPKRSDFKPNSVAKRINFIAANVDRVKSSAPHKPPPRYVDTQVGDVHEFNNAGLIPQYIHASKFGKVPKYLRMRNETLYYQKIHCLERSKFGDKEDDTPCEGVRQLNYLERQQILSGLKNNFNELQKAYQGLSLFTDTYAKKVHKTKLENQLRQLEQDMHLLKSNPTILVCED